MPFTVRTLLGESASLLAREQPLEDPVPVHGDPARFAPFADIPALASATSVIDAWDGKLKTARAWSPAGVATPFELFPTKEQIRKLYDAGFTIVLEDIESFVPALRPLCRELEQDLGVAPGKVNVEVFCALKGGKGRPHFDPSFTFNCQVAGTKTWSLARNEALRFPPVGMFLGRSIDAALEDLIVDPLPTAMPANAQTFVAQPGSVVFLPPGVLHATHMETASYAIAFAIEHTETIAKAVTTRVQRELQRIPEFRASRLGAQQRALQSEAKSVAAHLRRMADELENSPTWWRPSSPVLRLTEGLRVTANGETSVTLHTDSSERTLTLEPAMVMVLNWAAGQTKGFTSVDATQAHPHLEPNVAAGCLRQLVRVGLLDSE